MKSITVNKVKIIKLKPLRKNFISRNKKLSVMGYYKNIKVKVYGVHDKNQGELRKFISKHKILSKYFPKLISFNDRYIVEKWVDGKTLKELNLNKFELAAKSKQIKKIINIMWSTKYNYQSFDYIDHIHKRINKKNYLDLKNIPMKINHNDLSLENIILSPKGLKIIDNEFLGCNNGWIFNIHNSFLTGEFNYGKYLSRKKFIQLWSLRKEWGKLINKRNKKNDQLSNFIKRSLLKFK